MEAVERLGYDHSLEERGAGNLHLVGGLEHLDYFFHSVGNVIIPTDELTPSFFRGVKIPPISHSYGKSPSLIGNYGYITQILDVITLW